MPNPGVRANVPYTYQEYCYLPNDGRRYEIIEGDLYVTPSPSSMHQTVSRRLLYALMTQLELPGIAYIFDAPYDVILAETTVSSPTSPSFARAVATTSRNVVSKGRPTWLSRFFRLPRAATTLS